MFIKTIQDIEKYIPIDGKFHDIQIINNQICVDGEIVNQEAVYDFVMLERVQLNTIEKYQTTQFKKHWEEVFRKHKKNLSEAIKAHWKKRK